LQYWWLTKSSNTLRLREVLSAGLEARLYGRQGCPPLQFKLDKFCGSAWLGAMKIPEFKPCGDFLGDIKLPCLVAVVKNSELPRVGDRHIAEFLTDPLCQVYLRGADSTTISKWQKQILDTLFEQDCCSQLPFLSG
jgi:hypothetical protein